MTSLAQLSSCFGGFSNYSTCDSEQVTQSIDVTTGTVACSVQNYNIIQ